MRNAHDTQAIDTSTRAGGSAGPASSDAGSSDFVWSAPLAMAAIAHEVRNPLLSVSANLELLSEQLDPHDARRRCVDRAMVEVDRLSGVVDRLVDFATNHRPVRRVVSLVEVLERALEEEGPTLADAGVHVVCEHEGASPLVAVDAELLQRALVNLVRNAREAMERGGRLGIRILARASEGAASSGREIVVIFDDEGPGVAAGMAARVFEPFVTTKATGTGLGLPLSRRIVRAHGGDLVAIERKGGRFELSLPSAAPDQTARTKTDPSVAAEDEEVRS